MAFTSASPPSCPVVPFPMNVVNECCHEKPQAIILREIDLKQSALRATTSTTTTTTNTTQKPLIHIRHISLFISAKIICVI